MTSTEAEEKLFQVLSQSKLQSEFWNETPGAFISHVDMKFGRWCAAVCILLGKCSRVCLCVCGSSLSPPHCVFAAGGGTAQLMSLSAAGWAWKRPFVGSCSTSSPCASDTHSLRGQERGMAPLRLPCCPLNWHIHKPSEPLDPTHAFRIVVVPYRRGANQKPKSQRGGKKHGDAQRRELVDFAGQRTLLFVSERSKKKKKRRIYSSWTDGGKEI